MAKQPSSKKNKITTTPTTGAAENSTSLDSVCTCQSCNHGLARGCLKFRCFPMKNVKELYCLHMEVGAADIVRVMDMLCSFRDRNEQFSR